MSKILVYGIFSIALLILTQACTSHKDRNSRVGAKVLDTTFIPKEAASLHTLTSEIHPISEKIKSFLDTQEITQNFNTSELSKRDYLKIIENQVSAMVKYQDKSGRIIDPVENIEKYYTTPCFAHAISVLVASSNIDKDSPLAKSGMKALSASLDDMVNDTVNGNHGDFYTWPVMLAYIMFKDIANADLVKSWDEKIRTIDISKVYEFYNKKRNLNWILVHASGEFLRAKEGFTSPEYHERMIKYQLGNFTDLGMYDEHGNPFAYDLFARHYLNGMLQFDYTGEHFLVLRDNLWRGAWTSLFMQSPFGELPAGFRSSHHIWNEAEQCVVFEIYAAAYAKIGLTKEASAFKRGAMLSLGSIANWIREDGSGYIVKNKFQIEKKHGYERYSVHTCYNMLAMSMLAQAWQFSNDNIKELPAPADIGEFVLPVVEPFHKVFANFKGNYIEYDTKGDQKYNPTGIIRVHLKGGHPQLGPSDGVAELFGGKGNVMALGPMWRDKEGKWVSLAKYTEPKPEVTILKETAAEVKFSISYKLSESTKVDEIISINDDGITVTDEFTGITGAKKLLWPMLINDGTNDVNIEKSNNSVSLTLNGKGINLSIESPQNVNLTISQEKLNHRNGIASPLYVDFKDNKITYKLKAVQ